VITLALVVEQKSYWRQGN